MKETCFSKFLWSQFRIFLWAFRRQNKYRGSDWSSSECLGPLHLHSPVGQSLPACFVFGSVLIFTHSDIDLTLSQITDGLRAEVHFFKWIRRSHFILLFVTLWNDRIPSTNFPEGGITFSSVQDAYWNQELKIVIWTGNQTHMWASGGLNSFDQMRSILFWEDLINGDQVITVNFSRLFSKGSVVKTI